MNGTEIWTLKLSTQYPKYEYYQYGSQENILQLKWYKNVDSAKAKKMVSDRAFFIRNTFSDHPSSYPGILSVEVGCPPEHIPVVNEDTANIHMECILLANSNFIYGNCNPADNHYRCLYVILYCPVSRDVFEIKLYTPIEGISLELEHLSPTIHCK